MKRTHKQRGFGVIEVILILVVLILIGVGGWYVWQAQNRNEQLSPNNMSAQNNQQATDPYAGWKTYCDDQQKVCFRHPADWSVEASGESSTYSVRVVNSANTVAATYIRNDTRDGAAVPYFAAVVSELAKADERAKVIGGFAPVPANSLPQVRVADSAILEQYPLTSGAQATLINTVRFKQLDGTNGSLTVSPIGTVFTDEQAKAWFESESGKTAVLIARSLKFTIAV